MLVSSGHVARESVRLDPPRPSPMATKDAPSGQRHGRHPIVSWGAFGYWGNRVWNDVRLIPAPPNLHTSLDDVESSILTSMLVPKTIPASTESTIPART